MVKPFDVLVQLDLVEDTRIRLGGKTIDPSAHVVFAVAVFLILERGRAHSRRYVAGLLWPSLPRSQASHRLRQTLVKLRQTGFLIESLGRTEIQLANKHVSVDYEHWTDGKLEYWPDVTRSLPIVSYHPTVSAEFSEWFDTKRSAIDASISRGLLNRIARHRLAGEWVEVELCASHLLLLTPLNEEATLARAEALAMRGDKHGATQLLDRYLEETGTGPNDLRLQATLMRRRIVDRVTPRAVSESHEASLIGRGAVLEKLGDLLKYSKAGVGQSALLLGDAGIGKSRILSAFAQFAALQGFTSPRVNCRPSHQQRPLSTFVELAPILRGLPGAIGCSSETLRFLDLLTKHAPRREAETRESGDPVWIYSGVQRALFDLIDAVAHESPLLIQLEDIHWMDQTSADLLRDIIDRMGDRRVQFALTGRETPDDWHGVAPSRLVVIEVGPLSDSHATDLIRSIVRQHAREMSAAYLEWCVSVAEGNPYFLSELTNHWIESGAEHGVPSSLHSVLSKRIARLDSDSLQVLQTCALLENNSTFPRVERVLEQNAHTLLKSIDCLGSLGMILTEHQDVSSPTSDKLTTKHELLSNAALHQLSLPARRFLHRRIGAVLEAEIDDHYSASTLWDCAKHWQLAGDGRRAWHLATSCAAHLMKVGLPTAAAAAYSRCLEFCATDLQRLEVLVAQTTAYYRTSAWLNVRETAARVKTLQARVAGDMNEHDDVELMDLRAQWQGLGWNTVLERAVTCLNSLTASPSHRAEAGVMALMLVGFQGDTIAAIEIFDSIERLVELGGVPETVRLQAKMVFHTNFGNLNEGVLAAKELVVEQQRREDIAELFRATCNAGVSCRVAGLFDDAEAFFLSALTIAETHNLPAAEQRVIPLAANMALEMGNTDLARQWFDRLSSIAPDPSNRFSFLEQQGLRTRLALYEGRAIDARNALPMTYEEASADPIFHRRTYNLALHVAVDLLTSGTPREEAVARLEQSFLRSRSGLHQAFGAFVLFVSLTKLGSPSKARRILGDYKKKYRRETWPAPAHLLASLQRVAT